MEMRCRWTEKITNEEIKKRLNIEQDRKYRKRWLNKDSDFLESHGQKEDKNHGWSHSKKDLDERDLGNNEC